MVENIREAIKLLAKPDGETAALICTVDSVDKDARTVDCSPINESAPLLGVNLQANQGSDFGVCLFPKVGSFVVVGFVADGAAGVVLLCDEIESAEIVIGDSSALISDAGLSVKVGDTSAELDKNAVSFNGGSLGGLVKVDELTQRLNLIESAINDLKTIFRNWIPVAQDGGAALKTAVTNWSADPLTPTVRNDYENDKVKH
ncbi:MAG: hypothetical protein J1E97_07260 [Muribaculaceae bacterium]|nr:hypothetical protein [Muribaculaceae bacterium]